MNDVLKIVEGYEEEMVNALTNMCRIPAIAPDSDGDGEAKRAHFLIELLKEKGINDIEVYKAEDARVSAGYRPNIVATITGEDTKLPPLWIVSHMDVVPTGDRDKWSSEPFNPIVKDGRLIGRGVEDNGQALIASLYAVRAILDLGMKPKRTVKLAFVADEEVGSLYGIQYLVKQNLFSPDDLLLVPDYGAPDGSVIEVVEKSHLQLKVTTRGKQVHASRPNKGINAFRAASTFVDRVSNELYGHYANEDTMFGPPISTFEATKKEDYELECIDFFHEVIIKTIAHINDYYAIIKDVQIEHAEKDKVGCGVPVRLWETRRGNETHSPWAADLVYVLPPEKFGDNDKLYAVYHVYGDGDPGEVRPHD